MRHFWTKFCCSMLRVLGIAAVGATVTACYGVPENIRCEYGTPYVDLTISGQVLDENNNPIKGIGVSYGNSSESGVFSATDTNGQFTIRTSADPEHRNTFLYAKDTDGEKNGKYQTDSLVIKDKFVKVGEDPDTWNMGIYEARDVQIKLKSEE